MVVGVKKVAFKTHGSADERQFYSSIRMLYETVKNKVNEKIQEATING
jgi:glycerol-3-phosphate acyltransferase PlsX